MGLDQYATARKGEATTDEDGYKAWDDSYELAYWRKHPNLQGFMEELWIEKGTPGLKPSDTGSMFGSDFNCVPLELNLADLDSFEARLDAESLPETEGFFFGDDADGYYVEQDREFIVAARNAIEDGYTVVYSSWW